MDQFIAEIRIFSCNFAPLNFASCDGQLLSIAQYTALFALIGTNFGGDGKTTFALPNFQGRVALMTTQYSGTLPFGQFPIGQSAGEQNVTLLTSEMPGHSHSFSAAPGAKKQSSSVVSNTPSVGPGGASLYSTLPPTLVMAATAVGMAGGSQGHNNMQPFLTLNYCIALQGVFPARS